MIKPTNAERVNYMKMEHPEEESALLKRVTFSHDGK